MYYFKMLDKMSFLSDKF